MHVEVASAQTRIAKGARAIAVSPIIPKSFHSLERAARVFVFLAEGFGAKQWRSAWERGNVPGFCDRLPYGYFQAGNDNWSISYSEDREASAGVRCLQKAVRKILGFDIIHAWYNRKQLLSADVIWTHTEREYLAVLCLWQLLGRKRRPKLIAQSVWLFDLWPKYSRLKRAAYRKLIETADVLTVLSPDNLQAARRRFPDRRSELVRFGIDSNCLRPVARRRFHQPIRILSLGSDMHRDWSTLMKTIQGWNGVELRIANRSIRRHRSWPQNVTIVRPPNAEAVTDLYDWADLVVVALKHNLHASGITVVAEAVAVGLPVICTDTGGMRAYFADTEITYVAIGDSRDIRVNIERLAQDDQGRLEQAVRAQQRVQQDGLTSYAYAMRHRQLSGSLLRGNSQ